MVGEIYFACLIRCGSSTTIHFIKVITPTIRVHLGSWRHSLGQSINPRRCKGAPHVRGMINRVRIFHGNHAAAGELLMAYPTQPAVPHADHEACSVQFIRYRLDDVCRRRDGSVEVSR